MAVLSNPVLNALPKGENSNLALSGAFGLYFKSFLVKNSYLFKSPLEKADISAFNLSTLY